MNNITQKVLLSTLENILEKISIFQGLIFGVQHLKSCTLTANVVMETLGDIKLFQCWKGIFFLYCMYCNKTLLYINVLHDANT